MAKITDYATSLDPFQQEAIRGKQGISETKYDTLTLAAAVLPNTTQFFATPSADLAIKNFDGAGILVSTGKLFLLQTIAFKISSIAAATTGANIVDLINRCALRLQVDQKIMGTFAIHQLTGAGGVYAPSQVAPTVAANPIGGFAATALENGVPLNQPYRVKPMLIEGQKNFAAFLVGPTGAPITLAGTLEVKVLLGGIQYQSIQ